MNPHGPHRGGAHPLRQAGAAPQAGLCAEEPAGPELLLPSAGPGGGGRPPGAVLSGSPAHAAASGLRIIKHLLHYISSSTNISFFDKFSSSSNSFTFSLPSGSISSVSLALISFTSSALYLL